MCSSINTVLIVGLGSIGNRYIGIIKSIFPDINIVVLRHKKCNQNDALELYKCVSSINDAVLTNPQVAIITNPASMRQEIIKKLAFNGINLLIEKPISNSSNGLNELIKLCDKNKCKLMVAYNLRFLPSLIKFKQRIHSGIVGDILSVRSEVGQYLPSWREGIDYQHAVSSQKRLGGGVLLELSHDIDYLVWIFGQISWVKSHISKQSDLNIDVEDTSYSIFKFKKSNITASLNMDFIRHDTIRQCKVIGKKGTLLWDGLTGEVKHFSKGGKGWSTLFSCETSRDYTYKKEFKSFLSSIKLNKKPCITGEDGAYVVKIVEAIKESSNENTTIYL